MTSAPRATWRRARAAYSRTWCASRSTTSRPRHRSQWRPQMHSQSQLLERPSRVRPSWEARRPRAAALASVAMAVPENVVTNETVAAGAGVTEQWIVHRTGVHERRHVREGERLDALALAAARRARARRAQGGRNGRRRRLHGLSVGAVAGRRPDRVRAL